jgi:hypothetical protein
VQHVVVQVLVQVLVQVQVQVQVQVRIFIHMGLINVSNLQLIHAHIFRA